MPWWYSITPEVWYEGSCSRSGHAGVVDRDDDLVEHHLERGSALRAFLGYQRRRHGPDWSGRVGTPVGQWLECGVRRSTPLVKADSYVSSPFPILKKTIQ